MKRRQFLVCGVLAPMVIAQRNAVEVEVMEVFVSSNGPSALLVHHGDVETRETFASWLRENSGKQIVCTFRPKAESVARIFRISLCFGRGLILFSTPPAAVRARERITIRLR